MTEFQENATRRVNELRERLRANTLSAAAAIRQAQETADDFIACYDRSGAYLAEAVKLLCEMALHRDPLIAAAGSAGLFPRLIERLSDSFSLEYCALYDRVFAQVIEACRHETPELNDCLLRFGLKNEADILARRARLKERNFISTDWRKVRKVILLSRVTLGADVAITSVMMAALRQALPDVELVMFGSRKLRELFGGDARVRIREVAYQRGGSLAARLNAWPELVRAVDDERRGYDAGAVCVFDPDSRLTQLGLLPVNAEAEYFFFESRSYREPGLACLSHLAEDWISQLFGADTQALPYVALPEKERAAAQQLADQLRRGGAEHLVSISFGVGGNARKRMPDPFEELLMRSLLADSTLIIDKGGNETERLQIDRLIESLRAQGKVIVEANENNLSEIGAEMSMRADALAWDGGPGVFAGLIAASDEYIGYDSAGQHIAAALGVPTLTVFLNSGSDLFAERWRPHGPGRIEVLQVKPEAEMREVLTEALAMHSRMRRRTQETLTERSGNIS